MWGYHSNYILQVVRMRIRHQHYGLFLGRNQDAFGLWESPNVMHKTKLEKTKENKIYSYLVFLLLSFQQNKVHQDSIVIKKILTVFREPIPKNQ